MILITNDDGILAPGLEALHRSLSRLDRCLVVAPDAERSASGHSITMTVPLRVQAVRRGGKLFGYAVSGTPADCVKIALGAGLVKAPRLVASGINPGSNTGANLLYSGTVSAATEAAILGLPAIAVSVDWSFRPDFRASAAFARRLAGLVLKRGLAPGTLLNVNVPSRPAGRIKGVKLTRQGSFRFEDQFTRRRDPHGRDYFWLRGERQIFSQGEGFDDLALARGYISVTPIGYDLTQLSQFKRLQDWPLA